MLILEMGREQLIRPMYLQSCKGFSDVVRKIDFFPKEVNFLHAKKPLHQTTNLRKESKLGGIWPK